MNRQPSKPPKLARWILKNTVDKTVKFGAMGDFEEQFHSMTKQKGIRKARLYYWFQIATVLPSFISTSIYWSITMFSNYFKIVFRNFKNSKGYSFINIAGLAVGLACCILILLYVQDELSYDRFHENTGRIYRLISETDLTGKATKSNMTSGPMGPSIVSDIPEVRECVRFMLPVQNMSLQKLMMEYEDKKFYEDKFFFAEPSVFTIFSFPLVYGDPQSALREPFSMVITEEMAEKYFGSENALGKTLTINEKHDYKITGVLKNIPHNSHLQFDCLASFSTLDQLFANQKFVLKNWMYLSFYTYVLLQDDALPGEIEKRLPGIINKYTGQMLKAVGFRMNLFLQPIEKIHLHSQLLGEQSENSDIRYIYIFSTIAIFVLLIACINFMNISTARYSTRLKEVGVRKVIGAKKRQLVSQFLGESVILSLTAALFSFVLVLLYFPVFNELTGKEFSIVHLFNWRFLVLTGCIVFTVGIFSGSYPAFFISSFQPDFILRGNPGSLFKSSLIRKSLVIFQFAISIILITGTGIVFNQLEFFRNKELGFQKEHMVIVPMGNDEIKKNYESFKNELLRNPGIMNVSASSHVPGEIFAGQIYSPEGALKGDNKFFQTYWIDYDFIDTYGLEIIEGRNFSREFGTDEREAFIINETAAEKFEFDSPINKELHWLSIKMKKGRIIGVVKDFNSRSLHHPVEPIVMHIEPEYFNYFSVNILSSNVRETLNFIRNKWEQFVPHYPFEYYFLDEDLDNLYKTEEKMGSIFGYFSSLAIFIACLGLFGLSAFMTARRTKEIGIRKILGASIPNIVRLLSKEYILLVAISNVIAWPIAYFYMNRWLNSFAYQIDVHVLYFILAGFFALLVAVLTVSVQAIRSARHNPVDSLRYE